MQQRGGPEAPRSSSSSRWPPARPVPQTTKTGRDRGSQKQVRDAVKVVRFFVLCRSTRRDSFIGSGFRPLPQEATTTGIPVG